MSGRLYPAVVSMNVREGAPVVEIAYFSAETLGKEPPVAYLVAEADEYLIDAAVVCTHCLLAKRPELADGLALAEEHGWAAWEDDAWTYGYAVWEDDHWFGVAHDDEEEER